MEIVIAAVKHDGLAIKEASARLQQNEDVLAFAVKQNHLAIRFVDFEFEDCKNIVMVLLRYGGCRISDVSKRLQDGH